VRRGAPTHGGVAQGGRKTPLGRGLAGGRQRFTGGGHHMRPRRPPGARGATGEVDDK
jgi:hypothetical protein